MALGGVAPTNRTRRSVRLFHDSLHAADAGAADDFGRLPLHYACWHRANESSVQDLLAANPDAAMCKSTGSAWLPLHIALQAKAEPSVILTLLRAAPAAAAVPAAYGWLPLHIAARRGAAEEVMRALISAHPAAAQAASESGETALQIARKFSQPDAARVLLEVEHERAVQHAERERERERQWWADKDRENQEALAQIVGQRERERQLAQQLVDAETAERKAAAKAGADEAERDAQVREALRGMKEQLEQERAEREYQEKLVAYEKAEVERLQKQLDDAATARQASSPQKSTGTGDSGGQSAAAGEWTQHVSKSGRPYWYNKQTKKSSWSDPAAA